MILIFQDNTQVALPVFEFKRFNRIRIFVRAVCNLTGFEVEGNSMLVTDYRVILQDASVQWGAEMSAFVFDQIRGVPGHNQQKRLICNLELSLIPVVQVFFFFQWIKGHVNLDVIHEWVLNVKLYSVRFSFNVK